MNLELRHLKVVVAIAETGSVTKAASLLGLAQPALTAQLQRIERTLGGPLFERDRRGARPTALGELVLSRARVLLPAMKGLQDEAARLAGSGSDTTMGRYRIGSIGGPVVGGMVQRLSEAQPDAQISTFASYSQDELASLTQAGKLDFIQIGACGHNMNPTPEYGLTWQSIAVDGICILMPEDHPRAQELDVDLADLAEEKWVAGPGEGCFADCFAAACARAGFTPLRIFETDIRGCVDMAESGVALALCQHAFRPPSGLVTRPLRGAPLRWRQLLGWHPDSPAAQVAPRLLEMAGEAYLDASARNPLYLKWRESYPDLGVEQLAAV
ncbi:LysR family transcriptional regulator [Actinoplanes sp. RD1]|uniref:LysR family transcriptional regulator n=1 Tax=Actinoplanes sp. RD1 TaxID=3064538 RepID=UPI002741F23B|nr:LysR family transcriptional regulator [Actinoplanes sp. RD1]